MISIYLRNRKKPILKKEEDNGGNNKIAMQKAFAGVINLISIKIFLKLFVKLRAHPCRDKRRFCVSKKNVRLFSMRLREREVLLTTNHINLFELDVSSLSAVQAATVILEHVSKLKIF